MLLITYKCADMYSHILKLYISVFKEWEFLKTSVTPILMSVAMGRTSCWSDLTCYNWLPNHGNVVCWVLLLELANFRMCLKVLKYMLANLVCTALKHLGCMQIVCIIKSDYLINWKEKLE